MLGLAVVSYLVLRYDAAALGRNLLETNLLLFLAALALSLTGLLGVGSIYDFQT